jgi:hypothetical protein
MQQIYMDNYSQLIGPQGIQGEQGYPGEMGHTGPQGIQGHQGMYGPTGPVGPPGSKIPSFINVFSTQQQQLSHNQPVIFESYITISGNFGHSPNTSSIWIWEKGYYFISANINQLQAGQFSIFKNGESIKGTSCGSLTGSALQMSCIIQIYPEDISIENNVAPNGTACKIELVNNVTTYPFIMLYAAESFRNINPQNSATLSMMLL